MPLYEYECDTCGHRFEQIRKFSDPPLTVCPECNGAVRKLVSSPAIQFKGTGWYVTDYANKGRSGTEASEAGGSSDGKSEKTDKGEKTDKTETKKTTDSASTTTKDGKASPKPASGNSPKSSSSSGD